MVEIRPFQKSDAEQVVTTMAAAFANDALHGILWRKRRRGRLFGEIHVLPPALWIEVR